MLVVNERRLVQRNFSFTLIILSTIYQNFKIDFAKKRGDSQHVITENARTFGSRTVHLLVVGRRGTLRILEQNKKN